MAIDLSLWALICGACAHGASFSIPVQILKLSEGQIQLQWDTRPDQAYTVWSTTALGDPRWEASPGTWIARSERLREVVTVRDPRRFFHVTESPSPYDPRWASLPATATNLVTFNAHLSPEQNGAALKKAMTALQPGERLEIGPGTYSLDSYTTVDLQGTAKAPIWITAADGAKVVLTRPNARQNVLNVGVNKPTRFVCFKGLEIVGGSHGLRLFDCQNVWVDRCRIHDTGDVGLSANARDTSHLHLTRNEIWNTGGTGEGMYLGGNHASVIMSESVVALNHVHHTTQDVRQGDGIEVKQGSWGNWIAENLVHDCHYPCILVYGTGGRAPNIVERNVCFRSDDNTMQVQGECIVRNNLVLAGSGSAFASQPHQGQPTQLTVVHNTFVNAGTAVRLDSWGAGAGMVFANNACYSQRRHAIRTVGGHDGVTFTGNVCRGIVTSGVGGHSPGSGLSDFVDLSWDGSQRNAKPTANSALSGAADAAYALPRDLEFKRRSAPHTSGCFAR